MRIGHLRASSFSRPSRYHIQGVSSPLMSPFEKELHRHPEVCLSNGLLGASQSSKLMGIIVTLCTTKSVSRQDRRTQDEDECRAQPVRTRAQGRDGRILLVMGDLETQTSEIKCPMPPQPRTEKVLQENPPFSPFFCSACLKLGGHHLQSLLVSSEVSAPAVLLHRN